MRPARDIDRITRKKRKCGQAGSRKCATQKNFTKCFIARRHSSYCVSCVSSSMYRYYIKEATNRHISEMRKRTTNIINRAITITQESQSLYCNTRSNQQVDERAVPVHAIYLHSRRHTDTHRLHELCLLSIRGANVWNIRTFYTITSERDVGKMKLYFRKKSVWRKNV